jgi:hypothetical protein
LHGFFVKEAMQICGNVLGSCVPGETVTFITGRGAHSEGEHVTIGFGFGFGFGFDWIVIFG